VRVLILAFVICTVVACTPAPEATLRVLVVAGPTCPVVSDPPDPACADSPVEGARLVILDEGGGEVARAVSDADGLGSIALPAGGFTVVPQPVEGLMGTAPPIDVVLVAGEEAELVTVVYDTGIR
jgi:hypothetical protein